jgi:large subunit ribosomal protein L29
MKANEIRELSIEELEKKLRDTRADVLDVRLRKQTGQLEKTHEVALKRKEVARFETILSEKKAAAKEAS